VEEGGQQSGGSGMDKTINQDSAIHSSPTIPLDKRRFYGIDADSLQYARRRQVREQRGYPQRWRWHDQQGGGL